MPRSLRSSRFAFCALTLLLPAAPGFSQPLAPSLSVQPPTEQGEHWDADNVAQAQEVATDTLQALLARSKGQALMQRDAHPKQHGCARASVHIDAHALAPELQVGVFAPDSSHDYAAWVRFSNGNPDGAHAPDIQRDIRGMAIKLMNVPTAASGSQDFVMLTSPAFFSRDGADYLGLHRAMQASTWSLTWYFLRHPTNLSIVLQGLNRAANPLQLSYFSAVPYKLGPSSMQFKASPCASNALQDPLPSTPAADFLRQRLVASLQSRELCYDLLLQPNRDPSVNQIENANLVWDQHTSPYIKVATVRLPQQSGIDSVEQLNFCENLSFNPWHSTAATRPLGQINRMRLAIYPVISRFRHQHNQVPQFEPQSQIICSGDSAVQCSAPK
jgi:hypothetical protein